MDTLTTPKKSHHNLVWPVTIIVASLIIGGSIYASQWSKQKSIERQQQVDLQANINVAQEKSKEVNANKADTQVQQQADQTEIYRKECVALKGENEKKYTDFINTCTGVGGNSIDYCDNSPAGKLLAEGISADFITTCIDSKMKLLY